MDRTTDTHHSVLRDAVRRRHDELAVQLDEVRRHYAPGHTDLTEPRHTQELTDAFLAEASRHVNAASAVLLRPARRSLADGKQAVHDYLGSARGVEVVLAHVKAHEYGSTYETSFSWPEVWAELAAAIVAQRHAEEHLAERLDAELADDDAAELAERLLAVEEDEPTRPHPYTPHTGLLGALSRRVMHRADSFWDAAEGRMVREKPRPPHKKPGLIGQYLLADPRFGDDDEAER